VSVGQWIILAWLAVNGLYTVSLVGKSREPKTPFEAMTGLVEIGLIAWLVVIL